MTQKVVVIGAGIVGACCAGWLNNKGVDVTIVDRTGVAEETSFGNAGSLNPNGVMPVAMPGMAKQLPRWLLDPLGPLSLRWSYLPQATPWLVRFLSCANTRQMEHSATAMSSLMASVFECYRALLSQEQYRDLIKHEGCLYLYESEEARTADKVSLDLRRRFGAVLEEIGESEIRQLQPGLSPIFKAGVFGPNNAVTVNPQRLTKTIVERVIEGGGRFVRAQAQRIEARPGGSKVVRTDGEDLVCDAVVVASGAWSHKLAATIGDRIPLESQRGYHVTVADPGVSRGRMVAWVKRRAFATPMETGLRVGGTVEIAGLKAAPNWHRADALLRIAQDLYPALDTSKVSRWMGHRPCLPDSLPVIGPTRRMPGVFYAFGHQHVGMGSGASTGRAVAELVCGESPQIDLTPFRADRF